MNRKQKGFTLIELVMVIMIIGILAAMALPKFVDLTTSAETASKESTSGAIKAALPIAIAELQDYPTVTQLATYIDGEGLNPTAGGTGITVTLNGSSYEALTYTDSNCSSATAGAANQVKCVKELP